MGKYKIILFSVLLFCSTFNVFADEDSISTSSGVTEESDAPTIYYDYNNKHFMYIIEKDGGKYVVVDGNKYSEKYEDVDEYFIGFTKLNKPYFSAKVNGKWFYQVGGKKYGPYDSVSCYIYNEDENASCKVVENGLSYLVYGGKKSGPYDYIDDSATRTYGLNKYFYYVQKNDFGGIVVNGVNMNIKNNVESFSLSNDGKKLIYIAKIGENKAVFVNNKKQKEYKDITNINFIGDNQDLYYVGVLNDDSNVIVKNGVEILKCFSVTYISSSYNNEPLYFMLTDKDSLQYLSLNGVEQKHYNEVTYPVFTSDNSIYSYYGKTGDKWHIIVNGKEIQ